MSISSADGKSAKQKIAWTRPVVRLLDWTERFDPAGELGHQQWLALRDLRALAATHAETHQPEKADDRND